MYDVMLFILGMLAPSFLSAVFTLMKCLEDVIKNKVK
jgi:hypothetical protein